MPDRVPVSAKVLDCKKVCFGGVAPTLGLRQIRHQGYVGRRENPSAAVPPGRSVRLELLEVTSEDTDSGLFEKLSMRGFVEIFTLAVAPLSE